MLYVDFPAVLNSHNDGVETCDIGDGWYWQQILLHTKTRAIGSTKRNSEFIIRKHDQITFVSERFGYTLCFKRSMTNVTVIIFEYRVLISKKKITMK